MIQYHYALSLYSLEWRYKEIIYTQGNNLMLEEPWTPKLTKKKKKRSYRMKFVFVHVKVKHNVGENY